MRETDAISAELLKLKDKGILIIVEGKKDKASLEKLGLKNILMLEGKALFEAVESIEEKEVALLTDLDAEGKKLYHSLKDMLVARGVGIDDSFRELLFKTDVRQIEGLASYMEKNEKA